MRVDDDARFYIFGDPLELTFDPAAATVSLEVGTPTPTVMSCDWTGPATSRTVEGNTVYSRTAKTTNMIAGSSTSVVAGDVRLPAGRYISQFIVVTADGQRVPGTTFTIDVH